MKFKNKTILILSQQDWGAMFISKHHYALELAKLGNRVYYINGPHNDMGLKRGEVRIEAANYDNLYLVHHRLFFPDVIKFKFRKLYDFLIAFHIKAILKKINNEIDLIWSFDLSNTIPLICFPKAIQKIYMPVDELEQDMALQAAKGASAVFSVTNEILSKFNTLSVPKVFLNHGVTDYFFSNNISDIINNPIQVALSGNFLRGDIDRDTLFAILDDNPNLIFNFYGTADFSNSNIGYTKDEATKHFVKRLHAYSNIVLHGQVPPQKLADGLKKADCFLICYDIDKDQSKGTNYHKVLEYLAVGKVIVSNNITTYNNEERLIEMPTERNNIALPHLFKKTIENIAAHNSIAQQRKRIDFAKQHTYENQLLKISSYIQ